MKFFENKIGLLNSDVIDELNKLGLKKSFKRERGRIMDKLTISLNFQKYIKTRKQKN